jgi:hypothetical protein
MKRRYEATHKSSGGKDAEAEGAPKTLAQKLEREVERLTTEIDDLKRKLVRAQDGGSLFDLRNDSVANIAYVIAEAMSRGRLQSLQQKLPDEIKRVKGKPAHAG